MRIETIDEFLEQSTLRYSLLFINFRVVLNCRPTALIKEATRVDSSPRPKPTYYTTKLTRNAKTQVSVMYT